MARAELIWPCLKRAPTKFASSKTTVLVAFGEDTQTLSPAGPEWVEAADVDGDGDLDLLTAQSGDSTLGIIFNWNSGIQTTIHGTEDTSITGLQVQIDDVDANGADLSVHGHGE